MITILYRDTSQTVIAKQEVSVYPLIENEYHYIWGLRYECLA